MIILVIILLIIVMRPRINHEVIMKSIQRVIVLLIFAPVIVVAGDSVSVEDLIEKLSVSQTRSLGSQSFEADEGRVDLQSIEFEVNSAALKENAKKQVDILGQAMMQLPDDDFYIIGHTDASGADQYNLTLSERRSNTVYEYLVNNYGIDPSRLVSQGKGEKQLKNDANPTAAENRRVEIVNSIVLEE